jgi:general secretion pathway protein O
MKANGIAGGLLLALYLLWLTATAPARLLVPMLPPGVQVGNLSGSVWRGAAQPVYWHGERLERLAWSLTLAGWQVSLSDPRGVEGQARLWGLRDLRLQEGRLTAPASLLSRWLMSTMPVSAEGEVTFSLAEAHFSEGRCRQITAGGAQWRQARLHSPVGSLELAQVNGTFRCTADGAVALTLRQDSHQLSLSGQGPCRPMAAICFAVRYSPGRDAAAAGAAGHAPDGQKRPGPDAVAAAGKMVTRSKNDDISRIIAALSLCLVWLSAAVRPGAGQLLQRGDLSSAAHVDPDRGRRADNPQHPGSSCPQCRQPIAWRDNIPLLSFLWLGRRARCCQAPIAWSYPLTELATGLLFILAGALLAPGLPLAGGLVLLSFLLILARIDARTQLLPDRLTLPLLWAGLLFNLNEVYIALPDAVAGAMAGYLALWSVYWLFRLLTGKEALGYGDFKLLAALGAWCGWQVLPQVLLLASASGLVWTLLQRLWTRQSLQQPLAFGPWLALAGGGIFLWQQMV